jgi:hypothetical protein
MSQPFLFYSEKCPNSKQVIETLKALNKVGLYKFVLVDTLQRNQIPAFLTKVPTLYNPETKDVIVGKDIYGYIAKPTNARKELPAKSDTSPASAQTQIGDLNAWGFEGAGRLTEAYSSWDAPKDFSSDGNSLYTFLGGSSIGGPPEPVSQNTISKEKTGSNQDVSARMKQMEKERESEFSGVARK